MACKSILGLSQFISINAKKSSQLIGVLGTRGINFGEVVQNNWHFFLAIREKRTAKVQSKYRRDDRTAKLISVSQHAQRKRHALSSCHVLQNSIAIIARARGS